MTPGIHPDLDRYQRLGAQWLAARPRAILADGPGLGKTPQSVAAADLLGAKTVLVVTPGVGRKQWVDEFKRWQQQPRTVAALYDTKSQPSDDVVIVSWSLIIQPPVCRYLLSRQWDVLILDEAHKVKNSESLTARVAFGNRVDGRAGLVSRAKCVYLLSGTIMPRHAGELWTHFHALFGETRSYREWISRYCHVKRGTEAVVGNRRSTEPELIKLVMPHILRRRPEDVVAEMPALRFATVSLEPQNLPKKPEAAAGEEIVLQAALAEAGRLGDDAAAAAVLQAKSMALATLAKWTGVAKAAAVAEYVVAQLEDGVDRFVVFTRHHEVIDTLRRLIPDSAVIDGRTKPVDDAVNIDVFEGRVPGRSLNVLILQTQKCSEVLNLTSCARVGFAEFGYVPADIWQAAKRCARRGQKRPVLAQLFSLAGSHDDVVAGILCRRIRDIDRLEAAITSTELV